MICPLCGGHTETTEERREGPELSHRLRQCLKCGKRFETHETPDGHLLICRELGRRTRPS